MKRVHNLLFVFVWLVGVVLPICYAADCTDDDYLHEYTLCKQPANTHSLVYYRNPASDCTGGVSYPSPKLNIPCNITCEDGQYVGLGDAFCTNCSSGAFSRGGALYVDTWNSWPSGVTVRTYSSISFPPYTPIDYHGWELNDLTVRSPPLNNSQQAILEFGVILAVDGHVRFTYLVDAEAGYDGLSFLVDDVVVLPKKSSVPRFTEFTMPLQSGFRSLKFLFYKDGSVSNGADAAFVQILDIAGVYQAWDVVCEQCKKGEYAPTSGLADCLRCPLNTYGNTTGVTTCPSCDAHQYSFPGSENCTARPLCTVNDYEILREPCGAGYQQRLVAHWLQPVICEGGVSLPAPTTVECLACDPGFYRVPSTYECEPCQDGYYPDSLSTCARCPAGTAATKRLSLVTFDDFPSFASTGCTKDCGTNGWRPRSSYIDAGVGHGQQVESWYQLDLDLNADGTIYFALYLECEQQCAVTFSDSKSTAAYLYGEAKTIANITIDALKGKHSFRWTFLKYSTKDGFGRGDTAKIYNITVTQVVQGGAPECVKCPPGAVAAAGSTSCSNCTAGFAANEAGTQCVQCQGQQFNDYDGGVCRDCLPGTIPNATHTACENPCNIVAVDAISGKNVTYDLRPLSDNGRIIGPFRNDFFDYSINICNIGGFDITTCHTDEGLDVPLEAHICQYDTHINVGINLGVYIGYYPLNIPGQRGLMLEYSGGSEACKPFYGYLKKRSSSIKLLCDRSVEVAEFDYDHDTGLENPKCHYNFVIRSQYACPVCSEVDMGYYYSSCTDGQRLKIYYWLESKASCTGGPTLFPPETVTCTGNTVACGAGQYVDETSDTPVCAQCKAGTYSVGGGAHTTSWVSSTPGTLPIPFITYCTGSGCSNWADSGYSIQSGNGMSVLAATYDLVAEGTISFKFKVFSSQGLFTFVVDGAETDLNSRGVSAFDWVTFAVSGLPIGRHQFVWKFTGGRRDSPSSGGLDSAIITDVHVSGTDIAGPCLPCPPGTYSGVGASECIACPTNYYSPSTSDNCTACTGNKYSLGGIGADKCLDSPICIDSDYTKVYGDCVNGVRNVTFVPLAPQACQQARPKNPISQACGSCPPTLYWNGNQCVTCPATQNYDNVSQHCVDTPVGFANVKYEYYFLPGYAGPTVPAKKDASWPAGFATGCSGSCGSPGWRMIGDGVDSGYHGANAVDSFLTFTTTLVSDGRLDFSYDIVGDIGAFSGLQVQVDGVAVGITVPYPGEIARVSIPLTAGDHSITWNYHQTARDEALVQVRNFVLVGGKTGGGLPTACPAGTFNSVQGGSVCSPCAPGRYSHAQASTCTPCANNTFATYPGSGHCAPCAEGTVAPTEGSAYCTTSCVFSASNGQKFDLSSLSGVIGPITDRTGLNYYFGVCNVINNTVCPVSHVCTQDSTAVSASNGVALGFSLNTNNVTTDYFIIRYDNGDYVRCANPSQTASTVIAFGCDTEVSEAGPRYVDTDSDSCITYFTWRTKLGCPVCKDSDYQIVEGGCDGKMKSITKIRNAYCNGPETIAQDSQECTNPTSSAELAAILVAIICFLLLVAAAVLFYLRNKKLTKKYSMLLESKDPRHSIELRDTVTLNTSSSSNSAKARIALALQQPPLEDVNLS